MTVSRKSKRSNPISASKVLKRSHISALLVTNLINIRYLSGLKVSVGYGLITSSGITVFVDDRYVENARKSALPGVRVVHSEELKKHLLRLRSCAVEGETLTLSEWNKLRKKYPKVRWKESVNAIEFWRRSKSEHELKSIMTACKITKTMLAKVPKLLQLGVSEKEIAWKLCAMAHELGAEGMAFETIVGFGTNTASPHHRPTDRTFIPGDLVQVDVGVHYNGYCSDYSRVYFTADPTPEQKKAHTSLLRVKNAVTKLVAPGVTVSALDRFARRELEKDGYEKEFCHALGHGVGLEIHEGVVLTKRMPKTALLQNEVITIEPGLYFPGKWGMRIEDTVIVR
ncbi:MAG: aminopeptidase P family protein [Candidatus Peribacteraceae bacterium]|nr:aminopeptidase P family protein [Candidatus Peribacteraceae bacterium]